MTLIEYAEYWIETHKHLPIITPIMLIRDLVKELKKETEHQEYTKDILDPRD